LKTLFAQKISNPRGQAENPQKRVGKTTPHTPFFQKTMKKTTESSKKHAAHGIPTPAPVPPVEPKLGPCEAIREELETWLTTQKDLKEFQLEPCHEGEGHEDKDCACGSHGTANRPPKVDLIVLIDTSGSMTGPAKAISDAAVGAIEEAKKKCPTDLRVEWLGMDTQPGSGGSSTTGTMPTYWPAGTMFGQTHEQYLIGGGYPGPFAHDSNTPPIELAHEQGADAIVDLSAHFNWRENACRAIFYISDTNLDALGYSASDSAATANAIAAALANDVTVFAHLIKPSATNNQAATEADYNNLCNATGGKAEIGGAPTKELYEALLKDVICNACREKCKTAEFPDIQPCISVAWGDGDCDCLETDDYEVLYVTVCNCYDNVTFANFSIAQITVTNADGTPVAILPDGTDSVEVRPRGPICFGDIGPCVNGQPNCKSREFVLYTRGAKQGKYQLHFAGICFDIVYGVSTKRCFEFELCYS
jgi:hypothetical protein